MLQVGIPKRSKRIANITNNNCFLKKLLREKRMHSDLLLRRKDVKLYKKFLVLLNLYMNYIKLTSRFFFLTCLSSNIFTIFEKLIKECKTYSYLNHKIVFTAW